MFVPTFCWVFSNVSVVTEPGISFKFRKLVKREAIGSFMMCNFLTFLGFATIHYNIFWKIGFLQHIILTSLSSNYSRICNFFILRQFLPISYPYKLSWVNCKVTTIYRSSRPEVFCNKMFLEISQNS